MKDILGIHNINPNIGSGGVGWVVIKVAIVRLNQRCGNSRV